MKRLLRAALKVIRPFLGILKKIYAKYLSMAAKRTYNSWAHQNENRCFVDELESEESLVSIVVPVYNPLPEHVDEMVFSVLNQHYQNWELILVNASDDSSSKHHVEGLSKYDTRINVITTKNLKIAANTNLGLKEVRGDFVAFLDHDDLLHPCALHSLLAAQQAYDADIIYSDEDKITHEGDYYFAPHCKPSWSQHLFENVNYINHLTVVRASLAKDVDGLRTECDGAQDYDFLLRIIDKHSPVIRHVARVLYHWRAAETSTARNISTKEYIFASGKKAMDDHFMRQGIAAESQILQGKPGFYKTTYRPVEKVSIIIDKVDKTYQPACANWLFGLLNQFEDKDSLQLLVGEWFEPYITSKQLTKPITIVKTDGGQKDFLEAAAGKLEYNAVIVFKNATTPRLRDYIFELASVATESGADIVQPIIVGPDNTIIDAGLVEASYGLQPLFKGKKLGEATYFGTTDWVRDIKSVSGSVFATTKQKLPDIINKDGREFSKMQNIMWAHTPFEWQSPLSLADELGYFNPQLGQSMFELIMTSSSWDEQRYREHE